MSTELERVAGGFVVIPERIYQNGRIVVRKLTIEPKTEVVPEGGITARLLRHVKLRFPIKVVRVPTGRRKRRPTRRRVDAEFYALLAKDYVAAWDRGRQSKPTAILALSRGVPIEEMRSQIHLARANGLLSETTRGKPGGELTRAALDELAKIGRGAHR